MEPDFWLQRWQEQAIGFHQQEFNRYLIEFWHRLNVADGATILVPLCGKSKDMLWLRDSGYKVLGVELSDIAVRDFFAENNITAKSRSQGPFKVWQSDGITIYQGDFFALQPDDLSGVDAIFDRAALIALPELMRKDYVSKLRQTLAVLPPVLLVTLQYRQNEMSGPPFSVSDREVHELYHQIYGIECCCEVDALAAAPQFKERGLSELLEMVYLLRPKR